jgi:PIN domain nuclease of toxin-antitoxin system
LRVVLDTHILLWMLAESERLGAQAKGLIEDPDNVPVASVISIWEVAIKWSRKRGAPGDMPLSGSDFADALAQAGIEVLASTSAHSVALDALPPPHGDPFDRLLLATARAEGMILLTRDARLAEYGDVVRLI